MNMIELMTTLEETKLVPVVKLDEVKDALPLGEALLKGGLPVAEVTFRTAAAEESIRTMNRQFSKMLVGAGTVINIEQAKRAIGAGAKFLVSPGLSEQVVTYAMEQGVPVLPGCCTPSEIMKAIDHGLPVIKFFPANLMGGINGIKSLAPVFPSIRFMPTGGVNAENLLEFLSYKPVIACGGSWMVKDSMIREGSFEKITAITAEAVKMIQSAK